MKAGREHRVPLSQRALKIVKAMHEAREGDFVFPGQKPGKPLSVMALEMVLRRMKVEGVTVHGFRSAFRDWAAECTNFTNEVCEAALAHVIENKAEAAYRRGDLFDKRRKLMEAWAAYCAAPKAGKVVRCDRRLGPDRGRSGAEGQAGHLRHGVTNSGSDRSEPANIASLLGRSTSSQPN